MRLTIGEAVEYVRARLDEISAEDPSLLVQPDDRNLDELVERLLPEAIEEVALEAPASLLEGETLTEADRAAFPGFATVSQDGVLGIDLGVTSRRALRLVSLVVGDSGRLVTEETHEGSALARMQLDPFVRGTHDAPVLVKLDDSPEYKPAWRYYTTAMRSDIRFRLRYFPKPELTDPSIHVEATDIMLESAASSTGTISVVTSLAWTITGAPSWLTLSQSSGTVSADITVTASGANTGVEPRTCELLVKGPESSVKVTVRQAGAAALLTFGSSEELPSEGASVTLAATATNIPRSLADRITVETELGSGAASIVWPQADACPSLVYSAQENPSASKRTTRFGIYFNGIKVTDVTFVQRFAPTYPTIAGQGVQKTADRQYAAAFTSAAGSVELDLDSNYSWMQSHDADWLGLVDGEGDPVPVGGPGSDSATLTAQANTSVLAREAVMTFTATEEPDEPEEPEEE